MRKIDYIKKIRAIEKENRLLKEANNSFGREDRIKFIECLYRTDKETLKCLIADLEELKTKYSFKEKKCYCCLYILCGL